MVGITQRESKTQKCPSPSVCHPVESLLRPVLCGVQVDRTHGNDTKCKINLVPSLQYVEVVKFNHPES
jgi:hypothetical protein